MLTTAGLYCILYLLFHCVHSDLMFASCAPHACKMVGLGQGWHAVRCAPHCRRGPPAPHPAGGCSGWPRAAGRRCSRGGQLVRRQGRPCLAPGGGAAQGVGPAVSSRLRARCRRLAAGQSKRPASARQGCPCQQNRQGSLSWVPQGHGCRHLRSAREGRGMLQAWSALGWSRMGGFALQTCRRRPRPWRRSGRACAGASSPVLLLGHNGLREHRSLVPPERHATKRLQVGLPPPPAVVACHGRALRAGSQCCQPTLPGALASKPGLAAWAGALCRVYC